jgi:phage-related tail fiber protein
MEETAEAEKAANHEGAVQHHQKIIRKVRQTQKTTYGGGRTQETDGTLRRIAKQINPQNHPDIYSINCNSPTKEQIRRAIKQLKNKKAAGPEISIYRRRFIY